MRWRRGGWFSKLGAVLVAGAAACATPAAGNGSTRLLADPAVSASHVAFVYAEDLWIANLDGTSVRRLTSHHGIESDPVFSPDGTLLAFSGQYDGNTDVYVVPAAGGSPVRLTWHPAADRVRDFTPDGRAVLFLSPRASFTRAHLQLFTVPVDGGHPAALGIPSASEAVYSPDGEHLAYTPLFDASVQWKNYRGGTASRLWILSLADHSVVPVPQPEGRCNDTSPVWLGERVFFRSDRDGEFNLYAYDLEARAVTPVTHHEDFPVITARGGGGRIVYEQAGTLHLLDPESLRATPLEIRVATDLLETRPRYVKGEEYLRGASLSPSGARAAIEFRGEILTLPAKHGDPRNLTGSPGVHERSPAWSPDGRSIAYVSDASGEYALHVVDQGGGGEVRAYELPGAGFYEDLRWSPDAQKISFTDNSWSLFVLDLASGGCVKVASEPIYGPIKTLSHSWSGDSRWLAYTLHTPVYFQKLHLWSVDEGRSHSLSDGLSDVGEPAFDAGGKYLYFLASTDAGPVRSWFDMSNADMSMTHQLYVAVLESGTASPLRKQSDEEESEDGEAAAGEEKAGEEGEEDDEGGEEDEGPEKAPEVVVDLEGLPERILTVPVPAGFYSNLRAGEPGKVYYLRAAAAPQGRRGPSEADLLRYDFEEREEKRLAGGVEGFELSPDGKKILYSSKGKLWIADTAGADLEGKELPVGEVEVRIDPRAEWAQMFHEAWRINRDYFYDPGMHGADWPALREKYAAFLPDLAVRSDLNRVIRWMCSELAVGHHRVGGGDRLFEPEEVAVGLLGADYAVEDGRYRFAKVYGGLNWDPELRSPLTEPGVEVQAGEYLLAVEGRELRAPDNLYQRFENTVDRIVEITVGPSADGTGARTVPVVPLADEAALRNRDWVEGNLRRVDEATGGRVAYVYVPNTTTLGHTYFKRYFFPQADRQAIILDERHNGGGQVADYYIDILRRPLISYWATRYGADFKTPLTSIQGPKVMLIDETAGSGGDLLPWMFRKLGLGPLIGRPTWGGLVGTLGFPVLLDGGRVTAPNLAIWTEDGFIVENVGVPPDIEVEQWPADVLAGRDPQLEKAIEVVLQELEEDPPPAPERPPFPVRVRR